MDKKCKFIPEKNVAIIILEHTQNHFTTYIKL